MDQGNLVLRLSEYEGIDKLNNLDQFLRQSESEALSIDLTGKDILPTPVLQILISAALHWTQRDVAFSITGISEALSQNLQILGADLEKYTLQEEAA